MPMHRLIVILAVAAVICYVVFALTGFWGGVALYVASLIIVGLAIKFSTADVETSAKMQVPIY
jgi:hypothetical protein